MNLLSSKLSSRLYRRSPSQWPADVSRCPRPTTWFGCSPWLAFNSNIWIGCPLDVQPSLRAPPICVTLLQPVCKYAMFPLRGLCSGNSDFMNKTLNLLCRTLFCSNSQRSSQNCTILRTEAFPTKFNSTFCLTFHCCCTSALFPVLLDNDLTPPTLYKRCFVPCAIRS